MTARLDSHLLVSGLLRRVQAAGGFATVLAKGDPGAGAILIATRGPDGPPGAWERGYDPAGKIALVPTGPADDPVALDEYLARRRTRDCDLWIIELDIADAKRFAAETIAPDWLQTPADRCGQFLIEPCAGERAMSLVRQSGAIRPRSPW